MNVSELIGSVVALHLRNVLTDGGDADVQGTARYIVDCLSADQTAAIARCILADPVLRDAIYLKLPQSFLGDQGLPEEVLTTESATFYRDYDIAKPILLVANTGDEEEQSLKELTPLGASELQARPELWVQVAAHGLLLGPDHARWWEKALVGLMELRLFSLDRIGAYVLRTRTAVEGDGLPLLLALGASLPALHFSRDTVFHARIKEKARGHASAWKAQFGAIARNRSCYLQKQTPTQLLLREDDLQASFDRVRDALPEELHARIAAFINAPSGWNPAAADLAECEWETIKPLFDGLRREKFNLGRETKLFYDELQPDLLTEEEGECLRRLEGRSATEPTEEDVAFYEAHRSEIRDDRKLKSAWDRFIFGKPRETEDFLAGLAAAMESLFNQESTGTHRRLRIRCDRATRKELRDLNVDAGLFFARRYAGLRSLLGSRVSWDVGQLFSFSDVVAEWSASRRFALNHSVARSALQLKFQLELEVTLSAGDKHAYSTQLVWKFNPNALCSQLCDDWSRLLEHPLVSCRVRRDALGPKGRCQSVDMASVKTLLPAYDRERGSLVSVYKKDNDLAIEWRSNLAAARSQGLLTADAEIELKERFDEFASSYASAITAFWEAGVCHASIAAQLLAYSSLLDAIGRQAKGDRNRELLLRPLLRIGTVSIEEGPPAAIVAPWHPLRLAALQRKAQRVAELVQHLLATDEVYFGDTRLFFRDLERELAHPYYPELVLGWSGPRAELLVLSDTLHDYSLHEAPAIVHGSRDDTNENPSDGSACVFALVRKFLALHPHEHANMSVVLYNCDSARLPEAVVDKLGALYEDDDDVRCLVLLRHRSGTRLRALYRSIISGADNNPDAFSASEATQDFMARLRICIIADQAPPPDPKNGCPYDIVFCQDVIARHAQVEWYEECATPIAIEDLVPAHWSRRRPAPIDDMKSVVYLCCPVQSPQGWSFMAAITSFLRGEQERSDNRRLLPARQLDFRDPTTAGIFEETHNLGAWVANYDELLDRRQLLNHQVRVIQYKQSATQGRNVVISSRAPLGLLRGMVVSRLVDLNVGLSESECRRLADQFIQDASDMSGDIVIRAAKHGRNASELMGVVLSRFLVRHELGPERNFGWYFLDDYAEWLGQREEQIADILALSPERAESGEYRLAVVITEAKYIDAGCLAAKRKESEKQLRDTMRRIGEAIFGAPTRLDRQLWLARLSDMMLDGVQFQASAGIDLAAWRRAIRDGSCTIYLRGYSHVFISGPSDGAPCSSFASVPNLENAFQEVFDRKQVRELVLRYSKGADPLAIRQSNASDNVWSEQVYRRPSDCAISRVVRGLPEASSVATPAGGTECSAGSAQRGRAAPSSAMQGSRPTVGPGGGHDGPGAGAMPGPWAYPGIDRLLADEGGPADDEEDAAWLVHVESRVKGALQQFQLQAKLMQSVLTPNCAILKFAGSANLTIDQVRRRRVEFLTTYGLDVISIRPEPGMVSLSVARERRRVITTPQLWTKWRPVVPAGCQDILIGLREDDGRLLMLSPETHAPHTLIAGATGSGKSVLMQNIILGIAATNTPKQAKVVLIDPKQGVDYFQFEKLPHLESGIIDTQAKASEALEALVLEMEARYARLREARVTSLRAFNRKVLESQQLPVIWLVHDEFAEWMLVEEYRERVATVVSRLGVKARAAGIYLVFAAQRPDANVMPMQLRANLGNRLILRVDSEGTSDIALGDVGAERLLGHGHLLAKLEGVADLCYAQVPLSDSDFIERVVAGM